jgi:hypothetical protein
MWFKNILNHLNLIILKMLPNILCSHIYIHIVLQLVNGWKVHVITSNMWLHGDCTCHMEFFVIGCLLPLVQGDY